MDLAINAPIINYSPSQYILPLERLYEESSSPFIGEEQRVLAEDIVHLRKDLAADDTPRSFEMSHRRKVDPRGDLWLAALLSAGQPAVLG